MTLSSLPDWLTALATVFALIFAARAASTTGRLLEIEQERDNLVAQDRFREQAGKVTAWWGTAKNEMGIFVRNASDAAVYKASVTVVDDGDRDFFGSATLGTIPPADSPIFHSCQSLGWSIPADARNVRLELAFSDAQSAHWLRSFEGHLSQITEELVIWADENRRKSLEQFAVNFLSTHQVRVEVTTGRLEDLHFQMNVRPARSPDIFITSHDRLAALVESGQVGRLDLPPGREALFEPNSIEAATYDGFLYAIPYAMDTVALFTNLDLVREEASPDSLEELMNIGKDIVSKGLARTPLALPIGAEGEAFIAYPLLISAIGADKLFQPTLRHDGRPGLRFDLATQTSIDGLNHFRQYVVDAGLDSSLSRQDARALFVRGESPFLISTGTALREIEQAGKKFRVSRVPGFAGGEPSQSITLIQLFVVGSKGSNPALARSLLLDQMTHRPVIQQLTADHPQLPALTSVLQERIQADSALGALHQLCKTGIILPPSPDYPRAWDALNQLETTLFAEPRTPTKNIARRAQASLERAQVEIAPWPK